MAKLKIETRRCINDYLKIDPLIEWIYENRIENTDIVACLANYKKLLKKEIMKDNSFTDMKTVSLIDTTIKHSEDKKEYHRQINSLDYIRRKMIKKINGGENGKKG